LAGDTTTPEPNTIETVQREPHVSPWLVPALIVALAFPTLATWLYFVKFAGTFWVRAVYGVGKVAQFSLPALYVALVEHRNPRRAPRGAAPTNRLRLPQSLPLGAVVGIAIVALMFTLFGSYFKHSPLFAEVPAEIKAKLADAGIANPAGFLVLALFYTVFHSLLEEYYWRWFVFGRLRYLLHFWPAAAISGLGFMAHHTIVIGKYFGGFSIMTVLLSLAVATGGIIWAWLYERSGSLLGPWLSHALVDAGLMAVGYDLVWR
jgi:membrane protease YdiL (CAAX protease family)